MSVNVCVCVCGCVEWVCQDELKQKNSKVDGRGEVVTNRGEGANEGDDQESGGKEMRN